MSFSFSETENFIHEIPLTFNSICCFLSPNNLILFISPSNFTIGAELATPKGESFCISRKTLSFIPSPLRARSKSCSFFVDTKESFCFSYSAYNFSSKSFILSFNTANPPACSCPPKCMRVPLHALISCTTLQPSSPLRTLPFITRLSSPAPQTNAVFLVVSTILLAMRPSIPGDHFSFPSKAILLFSNLEKSTP